MLVIRLQRTGRKGHAQFRVVVQDSRRTPTSGKIVAQVGTYNPHTKELTLKKERAQHYLDHGAQPSERVAALLKKDGIKLPSWVKEPSKKGQTAQPREAPPQSAERGSCRSSCRGGTSRGNAPADDAAETPAETPAEEKSAE